MIYPHSGILFDNIFVNKRAWSTDTCYNMGDPLYYKHYIKWKKSDTKGHILWPSYVQFIGNVHTGKSIEKESIFVVARG